MLMTLEKLQNVTYYAGIMLDAFAILLCSKLCWHNWLKPTQDVASRFTIPLASNGSQFSLVSIASGSGLVTIIGPSNP